jgi:hypothetical protein
MGWYGFSYGVLIVLNMFNQCFVQSYYFFKFSKHYFIKEDHRKHICVIRCVLCTEEIHRLGQNYLCDFHLWSLNPWK